MRRQIIVGKVPAPPLRRVAAPRPKPIKNFADLKGWTLKRAEYISKNETIEFETTDGDTYALFHVDDCCESVTVESIVGEFDDLIGTPILLAEEAESPDSPPGCATHPESQTWTFYKLRTIKGSVDIRWHGTSNVYYSESVTFGKVKKKKRK